MSDSVNCPQCQRRLLLPEGVLDQTVQCPSCGKEFLAASALPSVRPVSGRASIQPPPAPMPVEPNPYDRRPEPPARRRQYPNRRTGDGPEAAEAAAQPRRKFPLLRVGLVIVAIMVLAGVVIGVQFVKPWGDAARKAEKRRNLPPLTDDEIKQQVPRLLAELADAIRTKDTLRAQNCFDAERMFEEARHAVPRRERNNVRGYMVTIREAVADDLRKKAAAFAWTEFEIVSTQKLEGNDVAVIGRHRDRDQGVVRLRWLINTQRPGDWRFYDVEDRETGLGMMNTWISLLELGEDRSKAADDAFNHLRNAMFAMNANRNIAEAERDLQLARGVRLPARLEAYRCLVSGRIHLVKNLNEAALEDFESARRFSEMPCLESYKATVLNNLARWEEGLKAMEKYRDLMGEDSLVCYEIGESLRGLNRFADAAKSYRKALDHTPTYGNAYQGLLRSLAFSDNRDDLQTRFAKLTGARQQFDVCAADCWQRRDVESLEHLIPAMRKIEPWHADVDYYDAQVKAWRRQPQPAIQLFKTALEHQPDMVRRREWTAAFLPTMASGGYGVKAYSLASEPREGFRLIAAELQRSYHPDELRRLVKLHEKAQPDDPLLILYRADFLAQEGQYQEAEKLYQKGIAAGLDQITIDQFRIYRVTTLFHLGRAMSAYADIGPKVDTFTQLANLCIQNHQDKTLETLLAAHDRAAPGNLETRRYLVSLRVRQGRVEEAIALYKSGLGKVAPGTQSNQLMSDFLYAMVDAGKELEGYRAAGGSREAFQIVSRDLFGQNKLKEVEKLLEAHQARDPNDMEILCCRGDLAMRREAWDAACQAFGEVMKGPELMPRNRIRHQYLYAMHRAGRWLDAYRNCDQPDNAFQDLTGFLLTDRKGAPLEALARARKVAVGPNDADVLYAQGLAHFLQGRPDAAVPLMLRAMEKRPSDGRISYSWTFLQEMAKAGRALEGYRAAPDRTAAFQNLASTLVADKKADVLEDLLKEHGKGDEMWPRHYAGELYLLRGEPARAAVEFEAALGKANAQVRFTIRDGLVRAQVRAGKVVEAYRQLVDENGLDILGQVCLREKNAGQLRALIDVARKDEPDSPAARAWELDCLWLSQDFEGALKFLKEERDFFEFGRHRWKADNYHVRCLLKLERTDEALREVEAQLKNQRGNRVLLVLAHAVRGDVQKAIAAVEGAAADRWLPATCYRDEELGPLLRSEPFAAFRQRFPEPKASGNPFDFDD